MRWWPRPPRRRAPIISLLTLSYPLPPAAPTEPSTGQVAADGASLTPIRVVAPPRAFLRAVWALILVGLLVRVLREPTLPGTYHPELDILLYSGQRLLQGQWLYQGLFTGFQHLAPILFAPSASLGSILLHRLLILALNLLGGWLLYRSVLRFSRLDLIRLRPDSPVPELAGALFVTFSQLFPSGLSGHLHQFANLFLVIALFLTAGIGQSLAAGVEVPAPLQVGSGLWRRLVALGLVLVLALSSLMRLSLPVLMVSLLVLLIVQQRQRLRLVLPLLLGAGAGVLLLFLPYLLLPGGPGHAWAGALLLPIEWNSLYQPDDGRLFTLLTRLLGTSVAGLSVGLLLLVPMVGIARLARRQFAHAPSRGEQPLLLPGLAVLFILELLLSFQKGDFDGQDLQLSIIPLVLLIGCGLAALEWNPRRWSRTLATVLLLALSLIYLNNVFVVSISHAPRVNGEARELESDRSRVRAYLRSLSLAERSFSAPQDVALHRQLNQPAATVGIGPDWSLNQQQLRASAATRALDLPTDPAAVCRQLTAPSTRHLVWMRTDPDGPNTLEFLKDCIARDGGGWRDLSDDLGLRSGRYRLFARVAVTPTARDGAPGAQVPPPPSP